MILARAASDITQDLQLIRGPIHFANSSKGNLLWCVKLSTVDHLRLITSKVMYLRACTANVIQLMIKTITLADDRSHPRLIHQESLVARVAREGAKGRLNQANTPIVAQSLAVPL